MRRNSIPSKLSAAMMLAACSLLLALGLVCGPAYGNAQSGNDTTGNSTPLTTGSISSSGQMVAGSKSAVYNIGSGNCTCNDPNTEYTIIGTSTNGSTVKTKDGMIAIQASIASRNNH